MFAYLLNFQGVEEVYCHKKQALPGPEQPINFQSEQIKLDIPDEGTTLKSGWVITPLTAPFVSAHTTLVMY